MRYPWRARRRALLTLLVVCSLLGAGRPSIARAGGHRPSVSLQAAFAAAAREFGVPKELLLAVSYNETLWEQHGGAPSTSGGYGLMHLTHVDSMPVIEARGDGAVQRARLVRSDPTLHTLDAAARRLGKPLRALEVDPVENIRGGAALLARYARRTAGRPRRLGDWYGAVAGYSGSRDARAARDFADAVFVTIRQGASRITSSGERISLAPRPVAVDLQTLRPLHLVRSPSSQAECPAQLLCQYVPAAYSVNNPRDPRDYGNYDVSNRLRNGLAIRYIVIHDTEALYDKVISGFQNPTRYASAHYVIRAADGQVTQMVPDKDIAWHAGNYYYNMHAIGIEHEGVAIEGAKWYSEQLYRTSADLVRYLAGRFHIPLDRAHIIGHDQVPGVTPQTQTSQHWDPGPYWDWQHYMELLDASSGVAADTPGGDVVTIMPSFATNQPQLTYCYTAGDCRPVAQQPANFVYLYTAPDLSAPLLSDPALHAAGEAGSTRADDWGDKVVTGEELYRASRQGDWDAVYYGGRKAWLYDPQDNPSTVSGTADTITPRPGLASIPVYGRPAPERTAYPSFIPHKDIVKIVPLQYRIPAGQVYVATDQVKADYYWSPTQTKHAVVRGRTRYYEIFFNHRLAFVKASDVTYTPAPAPG